MNVVIKNIKSIMEKRGVKHKIIAEKAGYSTQQFSNILNGRKLLKVDDICRIAIALEVTPNDLFGIVTQKAS